MKKKKERKKEKHSFVCSFRSLCFFLHPPLRFSLLSFFLFLFLCLSSLFLRSFSLLPPETRSSYSSAVFRYYSVDALKRQYGRITDYVAPKHPHPTSIMNLANTGGPCRGSNKGNVIGNDRGTRSLLNTFSLSFFLPSFLSVYIYISSPSFPLFFRLCSLSRPHPSDKYPRSNVLPCF